MTTTYQSGDVALQWDVNLGSCDVVFQDNDLLTDAGLITAVYISIFTNKRAAPGMTLPDFRDTDPRGWWGDSISPDVEGDEIGSWLWLLERNSLSQETSNFAVEYIKDSLKWMIEDGLARSIDVETELQGESERLAFKVIIKKGEGEDLTLNFDSLWEVTINGL